MPASRRGAASSVLPAPGSDVPICSPPTLAMISRGRRRAGNIARFCPSFAAAVEIPVNTLDQIEAAQLRQDIPAFGPGDTVKVHVRVVEGGRERVQVFEGVVIGRSGGGLRETFTVRKISFGVGVERIFPVHAPILAKIEVTRRGDVRRAKLYYLRDRVGKAARIKEKRT